MRYLCLSLTGLIVGATLLSQPATAAPEDPEASEEAGKDASDDKAEAYAAALKQFQSAETSAAYLSEAYGYALFPSVGEGGFVIGGAHGKGRVFKQGVHTGTSAVTSITVGAQVGGQAYAELVVFQNEEAYDRFVSGQFEFSAQAKAVAVTAGASAQAGSASGSGSGASGTPQTAKNQAHWQNGMAVFTIAKGGMMYAAAVGGQKFSFKPLKAE